MSKPSARKPTVVTSGYETSIPRCVIAAVLVVLGIAWMAVYYTVARDAALALPGAKKPSNPLPFMADLEKWNYLIGFGLIFVGLAVSAHKSTPAGPRSRRGDRDARLLPGRPGLDRDVLLHRLRTARSR